MRGALIAAALVLGLLLSQPAQAAPDLKAMRGVWRGTIGNLPIQACYDAGEYSNNGKYFYMRRLSTIPLMPDKKVPGELTEGWADTKGVARWRIKTITNNEAEGVWTGNGRTLPIRLTRLPFATNEEFDGPCGSLAFVQPIFAAARIAKSPGRVHGLAIEKWKLDFPDDSVSVESFQLLGSGPAMPRSTGAFASRSTRRTRGGNGACAMQAHGASAIATKSRHDLSPRAGCR